MVDKPKASSRMAHKVRLPGFVTDDEIGLGDVFKNITSAIGIKPCGGCKRRAAYLNSKVVFYGKSSK